MGEFKFKIEQNEDDFIVELGISKNGKKVDIPKKELKGDPNLILEKSVISKISEIVAKEFKWSGEVKLELNDAIKEEIRNIASYNWMQFQGNWSPNSLSPNLVMGDFSLYK